jgi:hypothetical protein
MMKTPGPFRPIAVAGFAVSLAALLALLAFSFDAEVRALLIAQYTPGFLFHVPDHVTAVASVFMILNLPTTLIGELVVRTLMRTWQPESRAIGNFAVWWLLTPLWWWFLGTAGYKRRKDKEQTPLFKG